LHLCLEKIHIMTINPESILQFREQKYQTIQQLVKNYKKPALVLSINKPTLSKVNTENLFFVTKSEIFHLFYPLLHHQITTDKHASYAVFIPQNYSAENLKKKAIFYEENASHGRLIDLDVIDEKGEVLHRKNKRLCFLCNQEATLCRHTQKHSINQIDEYIQTIVKSKDQTLFDELATKAIQALSFELHTSPKPGLVDKDNSGAHNDMDFSTFLRSINSLYPYFRECAKIGFSKTDVLCRVRKAGRNAEYQMYQATGGVNTHKGAIFTLGLSTAAVASHYYTKPKLKDFTKTIANYTKGISSELKNELTHGAIVYKKYGVRGARGEVEDGLPNVTKAYEIIKTRLEDSDDTNDAFLYTLLFLMSQVDDSNILYRHNGEVLKKVQDDAKRALEMEKSKRLAFLTKLDKTYSKKRISPGGSADLLSVVCFFVLVLHPKLLKQKYEKNR